MLARGPKKVLALVAKADLPRSQTFRSLQAQKEGKRELKTGPKQS
jgi:hypothetical protein